MASNNLDTLCEQTVASLITGNVYTGADSQTRALPCSIVECQGGEEHPIGSGNFRLTVAIKYMSNADATTLSAHKSAEATAFDLILTDTLASDLSAAASGFFVMGAVNRLFAPVSVQDRAWVSEIRLDLYCCAADL